MNLSLIIPTTSKSKCLDLCIQSVLHESNEKIVKEIILVNNYDDENWEPNINVNIDLKVLNIKSKKNSISKSWNIGLLNKKNDIAILSNDDVIYAPGCILSLYKSFISKNKKCIFSPFDFYQIFNLRKLIFENLPDGLNTELDNKKFYAFFNILRALKSENKFSINELNQICESRFFQPIEIIEKVYGGINEMNTFWNKFLPYMKNFELVKEPQGFSFMLDNEIISRVGLFDENFQIGFWEDVDYFSRCRFEGIETETLPTAFCHHFGSSTFNGIIRKSDFNYHDSNKEFLLQKEKRYYKETEIKLTSSKNYLMEKPCNLSETKHVKLKIDVSKATKGGNIICFNTIIGDPLYYFLIDIIRGSVVLMQHGYFDISTETWKNMKIGSKTNVGSFYFEILDGTDILIDGNLVGKIPKIETKFMSLGDVRNKTPNSDADIFLETIE